jgi:Ca2+/Na+ antiporter
MIGQVLVPLCVFFVCANGLSHHNCHNLTESTNPDWITNGGWIILFLTIILCFYGLATVCEDYYVPALKIMCLKYNIPDAVAGSTFMAAGASSPELFVSVSALFIEDSSIGLGTVVGSEIFNHLIISAASCLFAEGGRLNLDKRLLTKDCFFYMLSMILLIVATKPNPGKGFREAFNTDIWSDCLEVTPGKATMLVLIYVAYATTTIYFEQMCGYMGM